MNRGNRQGYILVQALVVIAGLVALMTMIAVSQRASMDAVQTRLNQRRAAQAADAAVAEAMATLSQANANTVTLNDNWATLGSDTTHQSGITPQTADEEYDMGDGSSFRLQLSDASSLININTAPQTQLQQLPLTQPQVDSLIDWRTAGETAQPDGAKDSFYNSLQQPYNAELGPLNTVDELLLVDNWTAQTLYQPPTNVSGTAAMPTDSQGNPLPLAAIFTVDSGAPNTQADGSARTNFNSRTLNMGQLTNMGIAPGIARQIMRRAPFANFSALLSVPGLSTQDMQQLLNTASFSTASRNTGKINLNTASQAVLQTLPNVTTTEAATLVTQQSSGYTSLGQLATMNGLTPGQIAQIADNFSIGSDTWIVRAWGQYQGAGVAVEASIRLTNGQVQVVNWTRINTMTIPAWWDWPAQSNSTVQAGVTTQ